MAAAEPGAWLCFADVALDAVSTCTVELSRTGSGPAGVTLRLSDPLDGPVIGAARATCTGGRYRWEPATTAIAGTHGVHDLFVVFDAAGVRLRGLRFRGHDEHVDAGRRQ